MFAPRCIWCRCKIGWTRFIRGSVECEGCAIKRDQLARRRLP